jgi:hypothetical protein
VVLPIVKHEANFILRLNVHRSCGNGSERCLTFTNSLFYLPSRHKVPLILEDTLLLNIRCPLNTGEKNSKYLMNCQNNTRSTGMQLGKGFRWVLWKYALQSINSKNKIQMAHWILISQWFRSSSACALMEALASSSPDCLWVLTSSSITEALWSTHLPIVRQTTSNFQWQEAT